MISDSSVVGPHNTELRKSVRTLRENLKNIVTMKLLDKTLIEEDEDEGCAQQKCDHICIKSPAPKCVCADGYDRVSGKCQPVNERLIFSTIANELFWNKVTNSTPMSVSITGKKCISVATDLKRSTNVEND